MDQCSAASCELDRSELPKGNAGFTGAARSKRAQMRASRSYGEVDSDRHSGRVRLQPPTLGTTMQIRPDRPEAPSAIRSDFGAIFVSQELDAVFGSPAEGPCTDWKIVPDHSHSDPMGRWIATGALTEWGCNEPLWSRPCKL
jgi:hypothetical protein